MLLRFETFEVARSAVTAIGTRHRRSRWGGGRFVAGEAMGTTRWAIDKQGARVLITAKSPIHTITATGPVAGWLEAAIESGAFVRGSQLSGELSIVLDDLHSGNALIDREMRRRVDTRDHPTINAVVESTEELRGATARINGTISFYGEAVLVEGEVQLGDGPRLTGFGEFDIRWWGLDPPRLVMVHVDPVVTVEIDLPLLG